MYPIRTHIHIHRCITYISPTYTSIYTISFYPHFPIYPTHSKLSQTYPTSPHISYTSIISHTYILSHTVPIRPTYPYIYIYRLYPIYPMYPRSPISPLCHHCIHIYHTFPSYIPGTHSVYNYIHISNIPLYPPDLSLSAIYTRIYPRSTIYLYISIYPIYPSTPYIHIYPHISTNSNSSTISPPNSPISPIYTRHHTVSPIAHISPIYMYHICPTSPIIYKRANITFISAYITYLPYAFTLYSQLSPHIPLYPKTPLYTIYQMYPIYPAVSHTSTISSISTYIPYTNLYPPISIPL